MRYHPRPMFPRVAGAALLKLGLLSLLLLPLPAHAAEVRALTLGIDMNCPYGLAG